MPFRLASPVAVIASSVTSWPDSKRASRSSRLTACVRVRNCSNGIDFFMCGPRSLRIRMWIGFWPPSNRARRLAPERAPQPFCPRPAVLPVPDPSPRPTRLRARREPGAGFKLCRPIRSDSATPIDLHQVANLGDHAPALRRVRNLNLLPDAAQTERSHRVLLSLVGAVGRPGLLDRESAHGESPSASESPPPLDAAPVAVVKPST